MSAVLFTFFNLLLFYFSFNCSKWISDKFQYKLSVALFLITFTPILFFVFSSFIFFFSIHFFSYIAWSYVLITILIFYLIFKSKLNAIPKSNKLPLNISKWPFYHYILLFVVLCFLSVQLYLFFTNILINYQGSWDARVIWNFRAKQFVYHSNDWLNLFNFQYDSHRPWMTHMDYPLLLPCMIAPFWKFYSTFSYWFPIVIAFLFTFGLISLIFIFLMELKNLFTAFFGTCLMLSTPFLIYLGTWEIADVPFAFLMLCSISFFAFFIKYKYNHYLIVACISVMMSAWCKNEGLIAILAYVIAYIIYYFYNKKSIVYSRKLIANVLLFILPIIVYLIYFKLKLSANNEYISNQNESVLNKITNLNNISKSSVFFKDYAVEFGSWYKSPLFLLVLYPFFVGIDIKSLKSNWILFLPIVFILFAYWFLYIITPHDIKWHLETSASRLLMHVYPSFVFLYFYVVKTPTFIKNLK